MTLAAGQTARYVVLRHEGIAEPHFDFMVEPALGKPLKTWRLPAWPLTASSVEATRIDDHRNAFLTYEGPLSGDRGTVRRVESGGCVVLESSDDCLRLLLPARRSLTLARAIDPRVDSGVCESWHAGVTTFSE